MDIKKLKQEKRRLYMVEYYYKNIQNYQNYYIITRDRDREKRRLYMVEYNKRITAERLRRNHLINGICDGRHM